MRAAAKKRRGATATPSQAPLLPKFTIPARSVLAGAVLVACFVTGVILRSSNQGEVTDAFQQDTSSRLPAADEAFPGTGTDLWLVTEATDTGKPSTVTPDTVSVEPTAAHGQPWLEQVVKSGDNLSLIFQRAGFSKRDVHHVVTESADGRALARIFPGQVIAFQADESGALAAVRVIKSPLETVVYRRGDAGFSSETVTREPEIRESWATGEISSSLSMAGQQAGLSQTMIMDLANIFAGVIDFVQDPRRGDTLQVVYEELYLDGEKYSDRNIIAASFTNQGKTFNAFRYVNANGNANYYSEDGVSMRKAFLLAPVDFTRISSNFNMKRLHPIYKTTRPHRGTDYAAPTGTPVYAAGDGRVIKAGYTGTNGNYVFIQHGDKYVTRYLHLNKRSVKQGQRVTQSQVIGSVGSTGAATGPHLHYEFLMNGVHRNPRTIHKQLPKASTIPAEELSLFKQAIRESSMQLASLRSDNHMAMNDPANINSTTN